MKAMKRIICLGIVISMITSLFSCSWFKRNKTPDKGDSNSQTSQTESKQEITEAKALMTVDFGSAFELTLDVDGTVASIYGSNEDGQILLYGERSKMTGMGYLSAIEYVTNLAVGLKQLSSDTKSVRILVSTDTDATATDIAEKAAERMKTAAASAGITFSVNTAIPFSVTYRLNRLKEKHTDDPRIASLGADHYRIASILAEREGIRIESAINLSTSQIITRINAAHKLLEDYATDEYLSAKREAMRKYADGIGDLTEGIYHEIYMSGSLSHLDTFYYGAVYEAYAGFARALWSIYEMKHYDSALSSYEADAATAAEIKATLGLASTVPLSNRSGKITIESLMKFADGYVNSHTSDSTRRRLEDLIKSAELQRELAFKSKTYSYATEIEALAGEIDDLVSTVNLHANTLSLLMSSAAKTNMKSAMTDLRSLADNLEQILKNGITESSAYDLATKAEVYANGMLDVIKADMSGAEWNEAKLLEAQLKSNASNLAVEMNSALVSAGTKAKSYIENARKH